LGEGRAKVMLTKTDATTARDLNATMLNVIMMLKNEWSIYRGEING